MAVHHVAVDAIRAASLGLLHFLFENPEIGGENGWRYVNCRQ
jgi:hypothetical protein